MKLDREPLVAKRLLKAESLVPFNAGQLEAVLAEGIRQVLLDSRYPDT